MHRNLLHFRVRAVAGELRALGPWRAMVRPFERLGGGGDQPFCTEFGTDATSIVSVVAHLRRLPEMKMKSFACFPMTDDVWFEFEYKGYPFIIQSPFASLWLQANAGNVPESVFREIEGHVINHRLVGPLRWLAALGWCLRLPRKPAKVDHAGPN